MSIIRAIEELERAKQCHPNSGYFTMRIKKLKKEYEENNKLVSRQKVY